MSLTHKSCRAASDRTSCQRSLGGNRSRVHAILWMLASTALYSLIFASGKLAGGEIPVRQIVFVRFVSGFLILLAIAFASGRRWRAFHSTRPATHVLRALCGVLGGICAIHAPVYMPIWDATAIGLTEGALTMLLAVLFLREAVSGKHWLAALVCTAGALVVVQGQGSQAVFAGLNVHPAAVIALLGALLIAAESILIKILSRRESALTVLLYVNGFACLLLALPVVILWQEVAVRQIAACLLLGPLALSGQYCFIRALRTADAAYLAPFGFSWILFAGLIGWVIFGETPSNATWLGSGLILAGGIALARLPAARCLEVS